MIFSFKSFLQIYYINFLVMKIEKKNKILKDKKIAL